LVFSAFVACVGGLAAGVAAAQPTAARPVSDSTPHSSPETQLAAATMGTIAGVVLDESGQPLNGVVISATGGTTSFAVTDEAGQFTLRALIPGPYLVRAHRDGYLTARSTIVNVRPSVRVASTLTLRREGSADEPRLMTAGVDVLGASAAAPDETVRDESETAWRLRHLRRSILKDSVLAAEIPEETDSWFLAESLQFLGRAVESSARMAGSLFAHSPLEGQVNLLTTGAFDAPGDLLQLERTRAVAFFAVGAPVGEHGDWTVKAALNQGDLSSWMVTGNYATHAPARHRYEVGMSYGMHRYEGGNAAALAAMPDNARNVGTVYAHDEWKLSNLLTLGYGANYAHYDYLATPAHLSPRVSATFHPTSQTRIRGLAARQVSAPGAEEFLPPARAHILPPQRTFSPLTRDGFAAQDVRHYEVAIERVFDGATIALRAFDQRIDNQLVTVFGLRSAEEPPADLGHYFVGSAGDLDVRGWGIAFTHALSSHLRGTIDYSLAHANWTDTQSADRARLARNVASALRSGTEHLHDLTSSVETEFPQSATRLFVLYKINTAFSRGSGLESRPGLAGRWDVQISQRLPFMNFTTAEWEMLIAVRNLFRELPSEMSVYDELLVAGPPKRLLGGITVRF
jgi:hypothetical protein